MVQKYRKFKQNLKVANFHFCVFLYFGFVFCGIDQTIGKKRVFPNVCLFTVLQIFKTILGERVFPVCFDLHPILMHILPDPTVGRPAITQAPSKRLLVRQEFMFSLAGFHAPSICMSIIFVTS